jgi:hypothetical protein
MCLYLSAVFVSLEDSYFWYMTLISVCRYVHFGRACCLHRLRGFLHGLPWIKRQQAAFECWYLHINWHDVIWTENRTFLFTSLMISYLCTLVFKALQIWLCVSNLYIRCQLNIQPYRWFVWLIMKLSFAEILIFSLMLSQARFMTSLSSKFSEAANKFEILIWYCSVTRGPQWCSG